MNPDEKALLQKTYELAQENNKILRKMRAMSRFDRIVKIAYWVIIIGLSLGAYYFIQPYVEAVVGGVESVQSDVKTLDKAKEVLQNFGI